MIAWNMQADFILGTLPMHFMQIHAMQRILVYMYSVIYLLRLHYKNKNNYSLLPFIISIFFICLQTTITSCQEGVIHKITGSTLFIR